MFVLPFMTAENKVKKLLSLEMNVSLDLKTFVSFIFVGKNVMVRAY